MPQKPSPFTEVRVYIVTDSRNNYETGDSHDEALDKVSNWTPPLRFDVVTIKVPLPVAETAEMMIEENGTNEITMR